MSVRRWATSFFAMVLLLVGSGCAMASAAAPKTFEDTLKGLDMAAEVAAKHGASWYADLAFDGSPEVYERTAFGLNSGLTARIHIQGNAQGSDVVNDPVSEPSESEDNAPAGGTEPGGSEQEPG